MDTARRLPRGRRRCGGVCLRRAQSEGRDTRDRHPRGGTAAWRHAGCSSSRRQGASGGSGSARGGGSTRGHGPPEPVRPSFSRPFGSGTVGVHRLCGLDLSRSTIDDETWDELEEALIRADVGVGPTRELLDSGARNGQGAGDHRAHPTDRGDRATR
ncbi:MAG: signal recognition particle receptor subunit alpha [Candidatus Microthrix sp.]|nr:signal recognition particle receptor subunit alpha [Candidatus Microthrix sp.]